MKPPANPDWHHVLEHRAWCRCGEWCSEKLPCSCCQVTLAEQNPCPHCAGTGVNPKGEPE